MELFEQLSMVVAVLALLAGMLWVLRRKGVAAFRLGGSRNGSNRSLQLVERLALTPNHSLHLVRVADRTLLIGVAPGGCTLLESQVAAAVPPNQPR